MSAVYNELLQLAFEYFFQLLVDEDQETDRELEQPHWAVAI